MRVESRFRTITSYAPARHDGRERSLSQPHSGIVSAVAPAAQGPCQQECGRSRQPPRQASTAPATWRPQAPPARREDRSPPRGTRHIRIHHLPRAPPTAHLCRGGGMLTRAHSRARHPVNQYSSASSARPIPRPSLNGVPEASGASGASGASRGPCDGRLRSRRPLWCFMRVRVLSCRRPSSPL